MKVAVTGGTGFIGRRLVEALRKRGDSVTMLTRTDRGPAPPGIRVIRADLTVAESSLTDFVSGAEVILHCAGELRDSAVMQALHVDGTRRLVDAAVREAQRAARPVHWVQLSSVGAYGPPPHRADQERVVTEDTPTAPVGEYETTKTLSDELVLRSSGAGAMTASVIRPTTVFGSGMPNGSLRSLAGVIRRGLFVYPGPPGAVATYVHVDDVVDALLLCCADPRAIGQTFNLSSDCALEEMIEGLARSLRVTTPSARLPQFAVRAAGAALRAIGVRALTSARIDALVARTRYPRVKLERQLGFRPRRATPDTIGEIL